MPCMDHVSKEFEERFSQLSENSIRGLHRLQPSRNFLDSQGTSLTVKDLIAMSRVKDCLSGAPLFVKEVVKNLH